MRVAPDVCQQGTFILIPFLATTTAPRLSAQQVSTLVPDISASGGVSVCPDGDIFVNDCGNDSVVRIPTGNGNCLALAAESPSYQ